MRIHNHKYTAKFVSLGVSLLLAITYNIPVFSQTHSEDVAITSISGEALVLKKGADEWQPAKPGDILSEGDSIQTLEGAKAKLQFSSGSTIILKEKTSLAIDKLATERGPAGGKTEVSLPRGRIKALIEKLLDEESRFEVRTPTAVAGVAGTVFYLNVVKKTEAIMAAAAADDNSSRYAQGMTSIRLLFADLIMGGAKECYAENEDIVTEIFVEEGSVNFTNIFSNISYPVGEGDGSTADDKGGITEPKDVPPDKQEEWKSGFESSKADKDKKEEEEGKKEKDTKKEETSTTQKGETSVVEEDATGDTGTGDEAPDEPEIDLTDTNEGTDTAESKDEQNDNSSDEKTVTLGQDTDGDGVIDSNDAFPNDPNEWEDSDGDGIGDNADTDDDNDGYPNINDNFPNDPNEWQDSDGDGIGDNSDAFPNDPNETTDSDNDGVGDNSDPYPLDPDKWDVDIEIDNDADGDGVPDDEDDFPNDANWSKWTGSEDPDNPGLKICKQTAGTADDESVLIRNGSEDSDLADELSGLYSDVGDMIAMTDLAQRDARWEEIRDAQAGKVVRDMHGNRVRLANYVLRPADNKVAVAFLSHRRTGEHAGVSSLTFEVTFNTSLEGVDLKNDIPWSDFMDTSEDYVEYSSAPAYYPSPGGDSGPDSDTMPAMVLTATNPQGDYIQIYEGFGPLTEVGGEEGPSGWYQAELELTNNLYLKPWDGSGTWKSITDDMVEGPIDGNNGTYRGRMDFADGATPTYFQYSVYVIDDYGIQQSADIFTDGSSEPLEIKDIRDLLDPDRAHNLELIAEATELGERTIDVIVAPEVIRPYDNDE